MAATRIRDRYVLGEELGRGGMGIVYRAHDEQLNRPVAVKLLADTLAQDEDLRERFVREARLAAQVQHPNVVSVYDTGEDEGRPFIVTELVTGWTLAERIADRGRLSAEEASQLVRQAALGLERAHDAGLIHRDIKPQNLLLAPDGTLKIADFGIARFGDGTGMTEMGTILGTAAYIAPEQARGERVTAAADVYAIGAVLYELLTGHPPHTFKTLGDLVHRQQTQDVRPVRDRAPDVPAELEELTMRCLARDPGYRPTAGVVAVALSGPGGAESAPTLVQRRDGSPPAAKKRAIRGARATTTLPLAAAAVVAVAAAVGGALALRGDEPAPVEYAEQVPRGETPAEDARNLAAWIREYSGGD